MYFVFKSTFNKLNPLYHYKNQKLITPKTLNLKHNMKNKTGRIGGFVLGVTGFLVMFKVMFLPNIPPEDELAPGIVVIISLVNGVLFAFIGSLLQNHFVRKRN